jgi:hypothetical protein
MRKIHLLTLLLLPTFACGAPSPPAVVAPSSPASSPPPTPPPAVAEPTPVLSAAQKPPTLMVVARLNDFDKSFKSINRLFKLPASVRAPVDGQMQEGSVILSDSVDVAVALGPGSPDDVPSFLWAFSVPLKSVDDAVRWRQAEGDEVVATASGTYRVKAKSGGDLVCDVMPSVGEAPARGVCAYKTAALTLLGPWMARGLAAEPKQAEDISVRVTLAPLKNRYIRRLKAESDGMVRDARLSLSSVLNVKDPDLLDVPEVVERETFAFVGDARAFDTTFTIDPERPELRLTNSFETLGAKSWLTQVLGSATDNPSTPSEMFFRLPKDAVSGWWGHAADPALLTGIRSILHKSVATIFAMPFAHVSDSDKQAILAWLDGMPMLSGTGVRASGVLPYDKRPGKIISAQQAVDEAKTLFQTYLSWTISGQEGDPAPFVAWLKQTQDVLRRGIAALEKENTDVRAYAPTASFISNPPGYPKGSAALDVGINYTSKDIWELLPQNKKSLASGQDPPPPPSGPPAKGKVTLQIVVVPEGEGHFWWGLSANPAVLRSHISQVLKGAPASNQLASRTDLGTIKDHKGFGGFFSLGSILDMYKVFLDPKQVEQIASLPHKGQGALYVLGSRTGTSAPTFSIGLSAGKDMLEDLSAAIAIGMAGQTGPAAPPVLGPSP